MIHSVIPFMDKSEIINEIVSTQTELAYYKDKLYRFVLEESIRKESQGTNY